MAHAERCPVCSGSGKKTEFPNSTAPQLEDCRGCDGTGWVTVDDAMAQSWPEPLKVIRWSPGHHLINRTA